MGDKTAYDMYEDALEIARDTGNTELIYEILGEAESATDSLTDEEFDRLHVEYYPN